jgi:hypothetical protein
MDQRRDRGARARRISVDGERRALEPLLAFVAIMA